MSFKHRPLDAVLAFYPWGEGELAHSEGPDKWQIEALAILQRSIAAGEPVHRLGVRSGHGVGKTAWIAWIIHWFVSTHPHPQVVVTANTKAQLESKTWRELAKWQSLAINGSWFEWSATRYKLKGEEETWYASAIPWSKHRSEAFAGTHEKHVLIIFDEASGIDPIIWEVVEGALTTPGAIFVAFGNPSQVSGKFADIWSRLKHRWHTLTVDSREAKMVNKELVQQWIDDYGEDSDFVRVRVKGLPPSQGMKSLIGRDAVTAAMERELDIRDVNPQAPLLMGVDVARDGGDDCAIIRRKGPVVADEILVFQERDLMRTASLVAHQINTYRPDVVFIDAVGMGAGVLDRLIQLGYDNVVGVHAGEKADDHHIYFNRRIEMWHRMAEWVAYAVMPHNDRLRDELTAPEFSYDRRERMVLESKEMMERRGIASPDIADALALTFAHRVPMKMGDEAVDTEPEVV